MRGICNYLGKQITKTAEGLISQAHIISKQVYFSRGNAQCLGATWTLFSCWFQVALKHEPIPCLPCTVHAIFFSFSFVLVVSHLCPLHFLLDGLLGQAQSSSFLLNTNSRKIHCLKLCVLSLLFCIDETVHYNKFRMNDWVGYKN